MWAIFAAIVSFCHVAGYWLSHTGVFEDVHAALLRFLHWCAGAWGHFFTQHLHEHMVHEIHASAGLPAQLFQWTLSIWCETFHFLFLLVLRSSFVWAPILCLTIGVYATVYFSGRGSPTLAEEVVWTQLNDASLETKYPRRGYLGCTFCNGFDKYDHAATVTYYIPSLRCTMHRWRSPWTRVKIPDVLFKPGATAGHRQAMGTTKDGVTDTKLSCGLALLQTDAITKGGFLGQQAYPLAVQAATMAKVCGGYVIPVEDPRITSGVIDGSHWGSGTPDWHPGYLLFDYLLSAEETYGPLLHAWGSMRAPHGTLRGSAWYAWESFVCCGTISFISCLMAGWLDLGSIFHYCWLAGTVLCPGWRYWCNAFGCWVLFKRWEIWHSLNSPCSATAEKVNQFVQTHFSGLNIGLRLRTDCCRLLRYVGGTNWFFLFRPFSWVARGVLYNTGLGTQAATFEDTYFPSTVHGYRMVSYAFKEDVSGDSVLRRPQEAGLDARRDRQIANGLVYNRTPLCYAVAALCRRTFMALTGAARCIGGTAWTCVTCSCERAVFSRTYRVQLAGSAGGPLVSAPPSHSWGQVARRVHICLRPVLYGTISEYGDNAAGGRNSGLRSGDTTPYPDPDGTYAGNEFAEGEGDLEGGYRRPATEAHDRALSVAPAAMPLLGAEDYIGVRQSAPVHTPGIEVGDASSSTDNVGSVPPATANIARMGQGAGRRVVPPPPLARTVIYYRLDGSDDPAFGQDTTDRRYSPTHNTKMMMLELTEAAGADSEDKTSSPRGATAHFRPPDGGNFHNPPPPPPPPPDKDIFDDIDLDNLNFETSISPPHDPPPPADIYFPSTATYVSGLNAVRTTPLFDAADEEVSTVRDSLFLPSTASFWSGLTAVRLKPLVDTSDDERDATVHTLTKVSPIDLTCPDPLADYRGGKHGCAEQLSVEKTGPVVKQLADDYVYSKFVRPPEAPSEPPRASASVPATTAIPSTSSSSTPLATPIPPPTAPGAAAPSTAAAQPRTTKHVQFAAPEAIAPAVAEPPPAIPTPTSAPTTPGVCFAVTKRIDPRNGVAYSYNEFTQFYASRYSKKDIDVYWAGCALAAVQPPPGLTPQSDTPSVQAPTAVHVNGVQRGIATGPTGPPLVNTPICGDIYVDGKLVECDVGVVTPTLTLDEVCQREYGEEHMYRPGQPANFYRLHDPESNALYQEMLKKLEPSTCVTMRPCPTLDAHEDYKRLHKMHKRDLHHGLVNLPDEDRLMTAEEALEYTGASSQGRCVLPVPLFAKIEIADSMDCSNELGSVAARHFVRINRRLDLLRENKSRLDGIYTAAHQIGNLIVSKSPAITVEALMPQLPTAWSVERANHAMGLAVAGGWMGKATKGGYFVKANEVLGKKKPRGIQTTPDEKTLGHTMMMLGIETVLFDKFADTKEDEKGCTYFLDRSVKGAQPDELDRRVRNRCDLMAAAAQKRRMAEFDVFLTNKFPTTQKTGFSKLPPPQLEDYPRVVSVDYGSWDSRLTQHLRKIEQIVIESLFCHSWLATSDVAMQALLERIRVRLELRGTFCNINAEIFGRQSGDRGTSTLNAIINLVLDFALEHELKRAGNTRFDKHFNLHDSIEQRRKGGKWDFMQEGDDNFRFVSDDFIRDHCMMKGAQTIEEGYHYMHEYTKDFYDSLGMIFEPASRGGDVGTCAAEVVFRCYDRMEFCSRHSVFVPHLNRLVSFPKIMKSITSASFSFSKEDIEKVGHTSLLAMANNCVNHPLMYNLARCGQTYYKGSDFAHTWSTTQLMDQSAAHGLTASDYVAQRRDNAIALGGDTYVRAYTQREHPNLTVDAQERLENSFAVLQARGSANKSEYWRDLGLLIAQVVALL